MKALADARAPCDAKTAVYLNAGLPRRNLDLDLSLMPLEEQSCVVRAFNFPPAHVGWDGSFLYASESILNFTPLRPSVSKNLPSALDRAVREVPWESREEIIGSRLIRPEFASESIGTPRREYQGGMMDGMRVRAVFNPYFKPHGQLRKQFDRWKSRDWDSWSPSKVAVRGSTKMYNVPDDIVPKKDELGEWREPTLSGRYQADIKRQYLMHGLPWIYKKDFLTHKLHILDKEPIGPKRWYKREYRLAKIKEAMRNMDTVLEDYKKEKQASKKKTWFEQIVQKLVGAQTASKYVTERKVPKL